MTTSEIDPKLPVKEILERYPEVEPVLAARGLDTCCGGIHPLEQACAARRVPLAEIVREMETARRHPPGEDLVAPAISLRDLRRRFPSTIPVLERYGLAECGGEEGPEEPLGWFATVHRLPLEDVLRDVRAAAARDAASGGGARPAATAGAPGPFSPLFLLGSLFLTLTLGATTGMINLLRIGSGGDVPLSHKQIHGHTQVLGFAAMFLMGIAYHALPRILGVGSRPPASAKAVFWMMFSGVLLRNAGQPLGFFAAGRAMSLLSSALEIAGGGLFAAFVFGALRRAPEGKYGKGDPLLRFLFAGNFYLLLALVFDALQGIWLAGHPETSLPGALTEPFYFAALYGFLLSWIYGFGNRMVSLFLGVGPAVDKTPGLALRSQAAGVACFLGGFLPGLGAATSTALRDAGMALVAVSALVYLAGCGFLWRKAALPMLPAPGAPTVAIRMAFGCLGIWALLEIGGISVARLTSFPGQNPWWNDAARHVYTIGFVRLLIVGMSIRILPVFSGKALWSPRLAQLTYGLIVLGALLRLLQYPAAVSPAFYVAGSYMGIAVVAGLVLFALNLWLTMRAGGGPKRPAVPPLKPPAFVSTLPTR